MPEEIYLDHAATTPTDPEVLKAMMPYFSEKFGNASTIYRLGREARSALDEARHQVASFIRADDSEIVFTSCGTESDNMALKGVAMAREKKGNHIISTTLEHHAVNETLKFLQRRGFEVTYIPVDKYGLVDPADIKKAITDKTILISVMMANNEVGTIEPIAEIGKIAKESGVVFHSDTVQAITAIPVDVNELGLDLLCMSAHKFCGPKGVGALYIRKGTPMSSLLHGGAQERRRRAGTENITGIVGMAKALELAELRMAGDAKQMTKLRNKLTNGLLGAVDDSFLNGHPTKRLPNNVNIGFRFIEGESILLNLDALGIYASTGSACSSATLEPSHVLLALGLAHEEAHGSIRFTLGRDTTEKQIDAVIEKFPPIVERLRMMSPIYQKGK
ncbi:MAG TPA: cysteine desulfurase NifS [Actinobacteria bacterium]|nr:cysteine desulfurase NifS [Actinomycetota bacterium]